MSVPVTNPGTALLLATHGSRRPGFDRALRWHAERVRTRGAAVRVEIALVNDAPDRLEDAMQVLAGDPAIERVVVQPWFLGHGSYVEHVIPAAVARARARSRAAIVLAAPLPLDARMATIARAVLAERQGDALVLLAHGAPRSRAVDELRALAGMLDARLGLLDGNPSFGDALGAAAGARVVVLPLFLHDGVHVADDVPRAIERARERTPGRDYLLTPHVGWRPELTGLLAGALDDLAVTESTGR